MLIEVQQIERHLVFILEFYHLGFSCLIIAICQEICTLKFYNITKDGPVLLHTFYIHTYIHMDTFEGFDLRNTSNLCCGN